MLTRSSLLHSVHRGLRYCTRCSTRSPHLLSLHSLQSRSAFLQLNARMLPSVLPLHSLHSVHSRSVAVECTHAPLLSLHSVHSRSAAIECTHAPLLSLHSVHSRSAAIECTHAPLAVFALRALRVCVAALNASTPPFLTDFSLGALVVLVLVVFLPVIRVQFLRSSTMSVGCSQCITCLGFLCTPAKSPSIPAWQKVR